MSFVKVNLSFSRTWNTLLPKSWIWLELPFWWQNHRCSCPCSWRASQCGTPRPWTRQTWASGRNRGPSFWRSLQPRPWDCFLYFIFRVSLLLAIFPSLFRHKLNWWVFEHEAMNKITISGTAKLLNCFWFYCKTSPLQELFHLTLPNWQGWAQICFIIFWFHLVFNSTITIFCSFVEKVDQIASTWEK